MLVLFYLILSNLKGQDILLLERLDISVNSAPVVVATFTSDERDEIHELSGEFQKLRAKPDFILEFSVSALDNPFKILGSNHCHAIIKNDGYNLSIDFCSS